MDSNTFEKLKTIFPNLQNNFEFVSSFTILWNIFESQLSVLRYDINYYGFKAFIDNGNLLNFSSASYINIWADQGDYNLLNLYLVLDYAKINKPAYTALINNIERVLNRNDDNFENQNFVGLCISYRIRNNLFHGSKNVLDLGEQRDIFREVNKYLFDLIDYLHRNSSHLIPYRK
jgi:hypothetical protein